MGRRPVRIGTRVEMLKARITITDGGYPAESKMDDPDVASYLADKHPAPEPGWFWIGATPAAAANIRRRGHRAIGTLTTTWTPPQNQGGIIDESVREEDVPPLGATGTFTTG